MTTNYDATISDAWNYWCYYRKVLRNKNTGSIVDLDSGKFLPSTAGMIRVGEKISELNDNEETIEYTAIAF